jgi:hypothetical protein
MGVYAEQGRRKKALRLGEVGKEKGRAGKHGLLGYLRRVAYELRP